jgi:hypothetical protein
VRLSAYIGGCQAKIIKRFIAAGYTGARKTKHLSIEKSSCQISIELKYTSNLIVHQRFLHRIETHLKGGFL